MRTAVMSLMLTAFFCTITALKADNAETVRYHDVIFEKSQIEKNIIYGSAVNQNGERENLGLDIYTAQTDTEVNRPVIMLIHGGGFIKGNDKTQSYISFLARNFARRGYVAVSIDYRIMQSGNEDYSLAEKNAIEDSANALEWIIKNAGKYGIDTNKIFILGGSAGGFTAVKLCYGDYSDKFFISKKRIRGVINCWGSPSMTNIPCNISENNPPMIIFHGTADNIVPFSNSTQLYDLLKEKKISVQLFPLEGGGHPPDQFYKTVADFSSDFIFRRLSADLIIN